MVEGAIKHLPLTGADLFGREAELAWLDACWRDGVFVASIVAWGGVGKTSVVTKWLARMRDEGWRGAQRVYDWSFYRQGTNTAGSSDTFFADALAKFGDPDPSAGSSWDKGERLAKLVRQKRTLLVLDGVEPMQYGPGEQEGQFKDPALQMLVKELASNNTGFLLITSRLHMRDLDGMSGAKVQARALEHLSAEAGASLLRARGARGTDAELQAAAEEYKGHALALTLLGSYLEEVAEGDIRQRNEIGPLHHDERNGGHARRVMTSYELLLGKTEVAILRMLGLFDRPATNGELAALRADPVVPGLTDSLEGVGGPDWKRALKKLRRMGLIAADTANAIDAHPLVRQHFGEQLKGENSTAFREGHRRLYEFLRTSAKEFPETIAEMEPLYRAVVHGCLAGKHEETLDSIFINRINRRQQFFSTKKLGALDSYLATLSAFFDRPWERLADGLSDVAEAFIFIQAGFALRTLGRHQEAEGILALAIEHRIRQENWADAARAASHLTRLLHYRGELLEAMAMARRSIVLADKSSEMPVRLARRTELAAIRHAMGDRDEAAKMFLDAEQMQKEIGPRLLYSYEGFLYCDFLLDQSRENEVSERASKFLSWRRPVDSLLNIALDHLSLGRAHFFGHLHKTRGNVEEATLHIQKAAECLRAAGQLNILPLGLLARAELYIHTREFANARRDLDEVMTIAKRCGFRLHETDAHLGYARLALAEGKLADARKHIEKARPLINETGYHRRDRDLTELEAMTKNQLLDALCKLQDSELNLLIQKLGIPTSILPSGSATRTDRVIALLQWVDPRNRIAEVEQLYQELMAPNPTPGAVTAPTTAAPSPAIPSSAPPTPLPAKPAASLTPAPIAFSFPQPLIDAYQQGKLAILFGSGLSLADGVQGDFPKWTQLPERLLNQVAKQGILQPQQVDGLRMFFQAGYVSLENMLSGLDMAKTLLQGNRQYRAALGALFRPTNAVPGDVHRALVEMDVQILLTTNYDKLLELVPGQTLRETYTWLKADQAQDDIDHGRKVFFKIHGTAEDADSIVMTRSEYEKAAAHPPYQHTMSNLLKNYTFLLVGYGINDPLDLDLVFELNTKAFGHAARTHYALMKNPSGTDRDRWQREMNIQTITYGDHNDLPGILRALAAAKP